MQPWSDAGLKEIVRLNTSGAEGFWMFWVAIGLGIVAGILYCLGAELFNRPAATRTHRPTKWS